MKLLKSILCLALLTVLFTGCDCVAPPSCAQVEGEYRVLQEELDGSAFDEEMFQTYADLFDSIARGSAAEAEQFAQLATEIINGSTVIESDEVFDVARDYATAYSRMAEGDLDFGVEGLELKGISRSAARLDFPYWGETWYSVKMIPKGGDWAYGEYRVPYNGELGKYLLEITFHDAEPSLKFAKEYPFNAVHKVRVPFRGDACYMSLRGTYNADHGYHIYLGSDEPFSVEEQTSVRLDRLIGTLSFTLEKL